GGAPARPGARRGGDLRRPAVHAGPLLALLSRARGPLRLRAAAARDERARGDVERALPGARAAVPVRLLPARGGRGRVPARDAARGGARGGARLELLADERAP